MNYKKKGNLKVCYKDQRYLEYLDRVLERNFNVLQVLKDTDRSYVLLIELNGEKLVYKEPREKNRRKWQRFVNFFRGSDSLRSLQSMERLEELGIPSTRGIMAIEKREGLFVTGSCILMDYLPGKKPSEEHYPKVIEVLDKIHSKGVLHGDSQLANFIEKDGEIYVIDNRPMKNIYGKIGRAYEYIYLEESCEEFAEYLAELKSTWQYRVAKVCNNYLHLWGKIRKTVKGKKV